MKQKKIGLEMKCLHQLLRRKVDLTLAQGKYRDITQMQSFVIRFLIENRDKGDLFQRDVEKQFGIRRATATGILQVMEREGLLLRESVDYDARLKKLVLTDEALTLDEHIRQTIQQVERQAMAGIAAEDLEVFWRVFAQMKQNLE